MIKNDENSHTCSKNISKNIDKSIDFHRYYPVVNIDVDIDYRKRHIDVF